MGWIKERLLQVFLSSCVQFFELDFCDCLQSVHLLCDNLPQLSLTSRQRLEEWSYWHHQIMFKTAWGTQWGATPGLRKLADKVSESRSLIFEKMWQPGKITSDWIKGNITPILNKKNPGNYQPVSLTSVPDNIPEYCPGRCVKKFERQRGEYAQPTWLHQGQIKPDYPSSLLWKDGVT